MKKKTAFDWMRFQTEVGVWALTNFGDTPAHRPLFGIVEEIGEFQEVGACEGQEEVDAMRDAIGDTMVFMAHYCHLRYEDGISLGAVVEEANYYAGRLKIDILAAIGRMCHSQLKLEQGIRGNALDHNTALHRALVEVVCWAKANTDAINNVGAKKGIAPITFEDVVAATWAKVSARDWKANPVSGGEA